MIEFPIKKYKKPEFFFQEYINTLNQVSLKINLTELRNIYKILDKAINNRKKILVFGNGGSASIANHFLCDFNKGVKISSKKKKLPRFISLTNSTEIITAIANDISYDEIFSHQIENYIDEGDCLIGLSCSGTSTNIIKALRKNFKKKNIYKILISGFSYRKLNFKVNVHLDLKCQNYGITEDLFSAILHMLSQYIRQKYHNEKNIL